MSFALAQAPTLAHLGIRWGERVAVRARSRAMRGTVAFSMESASSADLVVDTRSSYPEHAAFLFITTEGERRSAAERSYVLQAPHGAVTRLRYRSRWAATGTLIHRPSLESVIPLIPEGAVVYTDPRRLERSMVDLIRGILDTAPAPSSFEQYAFAQLLTEMGAAVLLDRHGLPPSDAREGVRRAAMAFIAHQSGDPGLAPLDVARHVRVSLRTLQAAFSAADTSIAAEIRRQRARCAHSLLTEARYAPLSFDEVAVRTGFGSAMTLRRALREEYGATPRSLRRR